MKTLRRLLLGLLPAITVLTPRVLALAGDLDQPSLALPSDYRADQRDRLLRVLRDDPARFHYGRFINAHTILRHGGDTTGLNHLLAGLMRADRLRLETGFRRDLDGATFEIRHHAWAEARLQQIVINTGSPRVDFQAPSLPPLDTGSGSSPQDPRPNDRGTPFHPCSSRH